MKRLFWISVGVGVTVYVMTKGRRVVKQYAPEAVVERATEQASTFMSATSDAAGGFWTDFKSAFAEREEELRSALLAETQGSVEELKAHRAAASKKKAAPTGPPASADDFPDVDPIEQELGYSF